MLRLPRCRQLTISCNSTQHTSFQASPAVACRSLPSLTPIQLLISIGLSWKLRGSGTAPASAHPQTSGHGRRHDKQALGRDKSLKFEFRFILVELESSTVERLRECGKLEVFELENFEV